MIPSAVRWALVTLSGASGPQLCFFRMMPCTQSLLTRGQLLHLLLPSCCSTRPIKSSTAAKFAACDLQHATCNKAKTRGAHLLELYCLPVTISGCLFELLL